MRIKVTKTGRFVMFLKTEPAFYAAVLVAMTRTAIVCVKIHSHSHCPPYFSAVGFGA